MKIIISNNCLKYLNKYILNFLIFAVVVICGCENNTTIPAPPNIGPPAGCYVSLQMTPNWIGNSTSPITFTWFSKHSQSGTATLSGYLNIKDISSSSIIHQEPITIYNDEVSRSTILYTTTMGITIDKIYEAYIVYNNNGEVKSQHLTFIYGDVNNNCYGASNHSINVEYDYMGEDHIYDLLQINTTGITNEYYNTLAVTPYSNCHTDLFTNYNSLNHAYDVLDCNFNVVDMLNTMKNYCDLNINFPNRQYIVSANKLYKVPPIGQGQPLDYASLFGLTPLNSSVFPTYRPCFVFYGYISQYGSDDRKKFSAWTFSHELAHTRGIGDNELHYQSPTNPICCIMLPSYPTSTDCPTNYVKGFCQYHSCSIYNNSIPNPNPINEDGSTNIKYSIKKINY